MKRTAEIQPIVTKNVVLSRDDFHRLSELIYNESGIKLTDGKRVMLEARLQKRLKMLNIDSFEKYTDYIFSPEGQENELLHMIDVVTTNKTDFFREPAHFDYLTNQAIPELLRNHPVSMRKSLMIWSAGCSSGEEPYTIAMVVNECLEKYPYSTYLILATDISTRMLDIGKLGIYTADRIECVPDLYKKKYFLKSKDRTKNLVRIIPEMRARVRFRRLNFMEGDFGFRERMDIIFCRNVIIYFDKMTQERLLKRICNYLSYRGYLFMGHSETLFGMNLPLSQVAPTIYKRI